MYEIHTKVAHHCQQCRKIYFNLISVLKPGDSVNLDLLLYLKPQTTL